MSGARYGRWTIVEFRGERINRAIACRCRCDCGTERLIAHFRLARGMTRSCGCLRNELNATRHIKHGAWYTPAYRSWSGMIQRCTNANNPDFHYYGGRGISVCDRWASFENFLADMGQPERGLTIDRTDPDGNYEPSNCRWATRAVQSQNRRKTA